MRKPGDGVKATPTCLASSNSPKCLGGGHTRAGPNGWWYRSRKTMKMLHGAARKQRPCGLVPRPEGELGVHQGRGPTISKRQCRQQMSCGCPATRGRRSHSSGGGVGLRDDRGSRGSACVVLHLITMHCRVVLHQEESRRQQGHPCHASWRQLHIAVGMA